MLKMLRFPLGVTRLDRIGYEHIRQIAQVGHFGDTVRVQIEMVQTQERRIGQGRSQRRDSEYIGSRMMTMALPVASSTLGSKHNAGKMLGNVDELKATGDFHHQFIIKSVKHES